ncbi:MAG: hypothetical protein O3C15_09110 [Proteobacteria bacterium]|nr:hypothetical protein [Pseudomonadota bacterium]
MLVGSVRKFMKGGLSPAHVWSSVVLGFLLGMIPDYGASAGLVAILLLCSALVSVNAGLFALSLILSKTILLLSLPWLFDLGQAALHGSLGTVFLNLSQLPVLAWFGFERYAMVGALVAGVPLALLAALVINAGVQKMRLASADLQVNRKFDAFVQSLIGRITLSLLLGKSAREGLGSALSQPVPLFRWKAGLIATSLVALLAVGAWQWAKSGLKDVLLPVIERANGATVDVGRLSLNLWTGTIDVTDLEVADPSDLSVNLFSATDLRVSISSVSLLSKRLVVSEVRTQEARSGMPRTSPGQLIGPLIEAVAITAPTTDEVGSYVKDAEHWLDRLRQVQDWLKRWEGMIPEGSESPPALGSPSYREWLDEQIAQSGYTRLSFDPIKDGYWSALAVKVSVDSVRIATFGDKDLTLLAENIASNPKQLGLSPSLKMNSEDGSVGMLLQLDELSGAGANRVNFSVDGLDAQSALLSLKPSISNRVSGGQIDFSLDGEFRYAGKGELAIDLLARLRDSELTIQRRKIPVDEFEVPVLVEGSFKAPKLRVDNKTMEDQLKDLAEDALKDEVKSRVEDKIKSKLFDRLKGLIK